MKRWSLGFLYVMTVPYVAGISAVCGIGIAGFRYTGWIWAAMLAVGPLIFLFRRGRTKFPLILWLPWFGYVLLSLAWVDEYQLRNFQDACQMVTPLIVGIVASVCIRNERQLRSLRHAFTHCLFILLVVFIGFRYGRLGVFGISYAPRAMALTALFVGCVFVAGLTTSPFRSILGWTACLAIGVFTAGRMVTFALLLMWSAYPLYRQPRLRLYAFGATLLLGVALFYSPIFQARFFASGSGSLTDVLRGDFSTAGRFEVWPLIWAEAKGRIFFGAGVGESARFVREVWPGIGKPHNDYLRIIFEQGLLGFFCFVGVVLTQMYHLRRKLLHCEGELRRAFTVSYLGLFVLMVVSFTENTIVYGNWYMHPLFAVLGAAYGVANINRRPLSQTNPGVNPPSCRLLRLTPGA